MILLIGSKLTFMKLKKELNKYLFLVQSLNDPSARVRVINLIPELNKFSNIAISYDSFEKKLIRRILQIVKCRGFDVVFVQRRLIPVWQLFLLKFCAKRIVFDFDDAIFLKDLDYEPKDEREWYSFTRRLKFKYFCKHSNLIIAGNKYLASEALKYNKNVKVLPSSIPVNKNAYNNFKHNCVPIIGWVGTEGNFKYLKFIEQTLRNISLKEKFIFRVISSKNFNIKGVVCDFIKWDEKKQEEEISYFDIGLMPLDKTPWSKGKCSYKLLQYLSCGVPFVASAVGMNIEIAQKTSGGFVVNSASEFEEKILCLLKNHKLRDKMSKNGIDAVNKYYSSTIVGRKLANELVNLIKEG